MANVKYFNGDIQLGILEECAVAEFDALFPGQKSVRRSGGRLIGLPVGEVRTYDHAAKKWSRAGFLPAQREITYKSNPSRHQCDARCFNATGRTMQCECSCGGQNHGKGAFICLAA